jgi:hypothetical protein
VTPDEYRQALTERGFHFNENLSLWVGPYNIQVDGQWNYDLRPFADTARVESLAVVDEKLRDKRGLTRPPSSGGPGAGLL